MKYSNASDRKFLKLVLKHSKDYIKEYPKNEQNYLNEFIEILKKVDTDLEESRKELHKEIHRYINLHIDSNDYLEYSFLWFTVDYFLGASRYLTLPSYYSDTFYNYLIFHLRNKPIGFFNLIRNQTSLKSEIWEDLQRESLKLPVKLSDEEINLLNIIYMILPSLRLEDFSGHHLSKKIKLPIPSIKTRNIYPILTMLDSNLEFRFFPEAFGIESFIFHIEQLKDISFKNLLDLKDESNTTLCLSNIYSVENNPRIIHGQLFIPQNAEKNLQSYLTTLKNTNSIKIHEITKITNYQFSNSLMQYIPNHGWSEDIPDSANLARKMENFKQKTARKRETKPPPVFISPLFSKKWNYLDSDNPRDFINLYCNLPRSIPIERTLRINTIIPKIKIQKLEELISLKVLTPLFTPRALIFENSVDLYWITLPQVEPKDFSQLYGVLNLLPEALILHTAEKMHIRAYLNTSMATWMRTQAKWLIHPLQNINVPLQINRKWFKDDEGWIMPQVLRS